MERRKAREKKTPEIIYNLNVLSLHNVLVEAYEYGFEKPRNGTHFYFIQLEMCCWCCHYCCRMLNATGRWSTRCFNFFSLLLSWDSPCYSHYAFSLRVAIMRFAVQSTWENEQGKGKKERKSGLTAYTYIVSLPQRSFFPYIFNCQFGITIHDRDLDKLAVSRKILVLFKILFRDFKLDRAKQSTLLLTIKVNAACSGWSNVSECSTKTAILGAIKKSIESHSRFPCAGTMIKSLTV